MKSKEFFNILDDIDDKLISEIYEDVRQPQKVVIMPRPRNRLPKILLGSAACLAVIAAAGFAVKFSAHREFPVLSGTSGSPGSVSAESDTAVSLSQTSDSVSMNDSGSENSENMSNWFSRGYLNPYRRIGAAETCIGTTFYPESSFYVSPGEDWSPGDYEFVAVDDGTVTFVGKISDAYGSAIVIKHAEDAYVAYGGADPDTVTVSVGDTVTEGQALANPKAFKCFGVLNIGYFTASDKPITEEYFRAENDSHYKYMKDFKSIIDLEENDKPDANGIHHLTAKSGEEVKAVSDGMIVYADSKNGTVVALDLRSVNAFIVYEGLGAALPDYKVQDGCKLAAAGDTIGYVSGNSDASWFVLDPIEFERFADENGIDIFPIHQFSKSMAIDKP